MTNLPKKVCRDVRFRRVLFVKLFNFISNYPYAVWLQFGWESRGKQEEGSWSVGRVAQAGVDFENWSQLTYALLQDCLAINIEIQECKSGAGDLSRNRISERYWGRVCRYTNILTSGSTWKIFYFTPCKAMARAIVYRKGCWNDTANSFSSPLSAWPWAVEAGKL